MLQLGCRALRHATAKFICNTQQHTATHSNTQQHTATHSNILQHTATKRISTCNSTIIFWTSWIALNTLSQLATQQCSTLQHTATHCTTLHPTATHCHNLQHNNAIHCNTLHNIAPHCTTLHPTATHCTTLQHTATRCNTAIVYLQRRHRFLSLLNLPQHVQPHSHVTPHPPSPPVITQVLTLIQRDDKIVLVERGKAVSCSGLH